MLLCGVYKMYNQPPSFANVVRSQQVTQGQPMPVPMPGSQIAQQFQQQPMQHFAQQPAQQYVQQPFPPLSMAPQITQRANFEVSGGDIQAFKSQIPLTAGAEYGLGLAISGCQKELLGLQQFRTFNTRSGPGTNISFSPEGITGTSFYDAATWGTPTSTRIHAVVLDATWAPGLASDRHRLVPIPASGYELFKQFYTLAPWDGDQDLQKKFVDAMTFLKNQEMYATKPFPEAPKPTVNKGSAVATSSSSSGTPSTDQLLTLIGSLAESVKKLETKISQSPPHKKPNNQQDGQ